MERVKKNWEGEGKNELVARPPPSGFTTVVTSRRRVMCVVRTRFARDDRRLSRGPAAGETTRETTWRLPRGYPADRATAAVTSCACVPPRRRGETRQAPLPHTQTDQKHLPRTLQHHGTRRIFYTRLYVDGPSAAAAPSRSSAEHPSRAAPHRACGVRETVGAPRDYSLSTGTHGAQKFGRVSPRPRWAYQTTNIEYSIYI